MFLQNRSRATHRVFFLLCLSINLWLYGSALMYCVREERMALWLYRTVIFLGVAHIAPFVFTFSVLWLGLYRRQKLLVLGAFLTAWTFYLISLVTPHGVAFIRHYFWGFYPAYGTSSKIFLFFFFGFFLAAFYNFLSQLRHAQALVQKRQIELITAAFFVSLTGSFDYLPKLGDYAVYPFGYLSVLGWILMVAYLIVRYRILDIQTVIHKTIIWLLASSVMGVPTILFYHWNREWVYRLPQPAFLALLIFTFVIVVLYTRHVQPQIDHWFQRRQWDLARAMERFSDELVHLRGLEEVVQHILSTLRNLFYATQVSLILRKGEEGTLAILPERRATPRLEKKDFDETLLAWLAENDTIIIREFLDLDPRLEAIRLSGARYFQDLHAVLCIPLVVNRELVGVLNIGERENLRKFTSSEIAFLADFRRSAAIALSNSLHILAVQENLKKWNEELEKKVEERTEQLKQTQAQLVQAEKLATIGTLAGGVAHEINNPLTAVLTNAQILKMSANAEDMDSIQLIEEGAKRCQMIIQKLMKYSRKPSEPEHLHRVDLREVISSSVAFLKYQLEQENIGVKVREEGPPAWLTGNANEIEQVLTNLILNAKDAIKQQGRRDGTIEIQTFHEGASMGFRVKDNGVGIPKEIIPRLFDPFFTTKDIGKGTGLGLAVTYGIVQKYRGSVKVESKPGEGATFSIAFPEGS